MMLCLDHCRTQLTVLKIHGKNIWKKDLDRFNNTYCAPLVVAIQSSLVQFPRGWEQVAFDGPSDEAHILKWCCGPLFFVIWKKRTPELKKPFLKFWGDCPVPLWLSLPLSFLRSSRSIPLIISGTVLSLFLYRPNSVWMSSLSWALQY